jgi:hypothetical protein
MNALQSSFQLISPTIFMGQNDACRHRSLQKMLRKNEVTGVAVVPDADRNLLFAFFSSLSFYQSCHRSAGATREQEGGEKTKNDRNGLTVTSLSSPPVKKTPPQYSGNQILSVSLPGHLVRCSLFRQITIS